MKNILSLMLVLGLFSCQQKEVKKTALEPLIRQYFAHFNAHEWEKMAAMYAEPAQFKDPSFGTGIVKQTRAETIQKYTELAQAFPNLKDSLISIYPSGENHCIVEFVSKGTAPDGTKFELPICTIFTLEKGQIVADFTYYDNFSE